MRLVKVKFLPFEELEQEVRNEKIKKEEVVPGAKGLQIYCNSLRKEKTLRYTMSFGL